MIRTLLATILCAATTTIAASTQPTSQPTSITVFDNGGKPVINGTVVFIPVPPKINRYYVFDGDLHPFIASLYRQWRTDRDGKCSLPAANGPAWVVAFAEQGWAHVDRNHIENNQIQLLPWARVTGTAMHLGKPAAGWTVQAQRAIEPEEILHDPIIYGDLTALVDAQGHFTFDRLPPEKTSLHLLVRQDGSLTTSAGGAGWLYSTTVDLAPGEIHGVLLHRDGRPVEGTITLPPGSSVEGLVARAELDHRGSSPTVPYPPDIFNGTREQRQTWFADWKKTPAYAEWSNAQQKALDSFCNYIVVFPTPTTFHADEVPPGTYDLDLKLSKADAPDRALYSTSTIHFTIPATTGDATTQPFTLPPVELHRVPEPATAGHPAFNFTVMSLTGKPIHLSDYRGKVLLLDFWATWCGPCIAENPNFLDCYKTFADTNRFAILSISYDETAAKAKEYVDAQHLPWDQAWIGDPAPVELTTAYAGGLPTIVLIGPDGKILALNPRGEAIKLAVADALQIKKGSAGLGEK